ncbi:MBL fold metallo-hydrolase [Thiohalophilus thiocyanatoxydans]|uniref:Glyoxylase-like metal-dependent hydrolase (Beta-lactamase superfamily II) n=1 Tax=Thiohalophilus thiocyanatoxydans TaxID=381308 RepID=A0A4R8IPR7_9GAMM|nr:MBL fold metallo-hydrolase [Thiohalophilus thiocyanatoxydans]TDX98181.1 glyoxylase-like metal-dependent hydrolase (beta-lactamase superfamily II) [Thiohalophilus thiocyanatoxydans]
MKYLINLAFVLVFNPVTIFAHEPQLPLDFEQHTLEKVSQHIYIVHGTQTLPSPETRGFMNNPSAILTHGGIIIVDPGSSAEIGRQLLAKLRHITDKPVIAVFNTHIHGDHWLGNQGIRETYPRVPIYAHARMLERVEAGEGKTWIQLFMGMTNGAVEGTRVTGPNIGLSGGEVLKLDGITLRIHHTGHAHTDHDLMIEVVDDKGLFFGDIVSSRRVPNSDVPQDASFKGSIATIKTMLDHDIAVYIPGHGRSGGREIPESSLRFLETLYASVTHHFNRGLQSYEMKDKVIDDLSDYQDWNNFNEIGRVINFVFQEVEQDNF